MQQAELEKNLSLPPNSLTPLAFVLMQSIAVGGTAESVALGLKVEPDEITSIIAELNTNNNVFDRALAILRLDLAGGPIDRDFGWNDLERAVLLKLGRVVNSVKDPDVLTRIAVAANRAKRSTDAPSIPTPQGINVGAGATLVLAGGNLGVMHLDLSHRVAKQLAAPQLEMSAEDITPAPEGAPESPKRGIEMLKLAEIRRLADDTPTDGEIVAAEKQGIKVDPDLMASILGREVD